MADTPPPGIGLDDGQRSQAIASMAILDTLPTLFVVARLVSRKIAHAGFWVGFISYFGCFALLPTIFQYDDLLVSIGCVREGAISKAAFYH